MKLFNYRKLFNRKKLLYIFLAFCLGTQPLQAIGWATGPAVGVGGWYKKFDSDQQGNKKTIVVDNIAIQLGWFAKLSLGFLYAQVNPLFMVDWRTVSDIMDKENFKNITIPVTIGASLFGLVRPHLGLIFRLPLDSLLEKDCLKVYRKKINSWILGIGADLGKWMIDLDFEGAWHALSKKDIHTALQDASDSTYRAKQFALRISYNLL